MTQDELNIAQSTSLQAIRAAIRSRNLGRLKEAFNRDWVKEYLGETTIASKSGTYQIFAMAILELPKEERFKAFQWTWDCYHPLMGELGKALAELDGYNQNRPNL